MNTFEDLLLETLKDLYHAELVSIPLLLDMSNAAADTGLKKVFLEHLEETRAHVSRFETVFSNFKLAPMPITGCLTQALEAGCRDAIATVGDPVVRDARLIAAAQRLEHYEMSGYDCVSTWAALLGLSSEVELLEETLREETAAEEALSNSARALNVDPVIKRQSNRH